MIEEPGIKLIELLIREINKMAVSNGRISERISDSNWFVYVLELENDKYYVGITVDPEKRFQQHFKGNKLSSNWCKQNKPIRIIESFDSGTKIMTEARSLEDQTTLKYILLYGAENVRGGKYMGPKAVRRAENDLIALKKGTQI